MTMIYVFPIVIFAVDFPQMRTFYWPINWKSKLHYNSALVEVEVEVEVEVARDVTAELVVNVTVDAVQILGKLTVWQIVLVNSVWYD